jgi:hypothetical protein
MQSYLKSIGVDAAQGDAAIESAIAKGPQGIQDFILRSSLKSKEFHEFNKPNWLNAGGQQVAVSAGTGQRLSNVAPVAATPTIAEQQRAEEVAYIDVGNQLVPVNKLTGRPVENVQPTAKGLTPGQQQEVEYRDVGDKLVPVYKYNGQPVPGMQPIPKNLTPGDQQRAQEVEYRDVGDRLVPVNKITGQPVEGMPSIPKGLTPGDQQRAQEVEYKDVGDRLVPVNKITGQPVEGAKPIPKGISAYQEAQLRNENQRITQEKSRIDLERRRVAVIEEQDRRAKDPAFQERMAAAKTVGQTIAKNDVAAVQNMPKLLNQADDALKLIDAMVGKAPVRDSSGKVIQPGTAPHPGFKSAVGMGTFSTLGIPGIAAMIPGTDAAGFMTYFKQTEGAAFLEVFEALKGGGAITEKEGEKATQARIRMSTTTDEKEFMTAAREYQDILRRGIETIKTRGAQANARLQNASPSPAASSGTPPPPPGFKRD